MSRSRMRMSSFPPTRPCGGAFTNDSHGSKIGIWGHLAVPPLPHHRAYGSRTRRFDGVKLGHRQESGQSWALGCWLRHDWFGPLGAAQRGFTPFRRFQGQYILDLLPHSTHESPVLLATPHRSGLRPSFPAWPICCSAFRLWSASLALPTAWPTMPSADFCAAVGSPLGFPSSETRNTTQTSPGKSDRLRRTPAGSTATALMNCGLRG